MADYNQVTLVGRLTKDPEFKTIGEDKNVTTLSMAVGRYMGRDREPKTDYFNVEVWGAQAKSCSDYLRRGSPVLVAGSLKHETWEKEIGGETVKFSTYKVVSNVVQFLESKKDSEARASETGSTREESGRYSRSSTREGSGRSSRRREDSGRSSRRESSRREDSGRSSRREKVSSSNSGKRYDEEDIPF